MNTSLTMAIELGNKLWKKFNSNIVGDFIIIMLLAFDKSSCKL